MKSLIAYYSRTGTTKTVAEQLANLMAADVEEIVDMKGRKGVFGFIISGYQAMTEKVATIKPPEKDTSQYDLVVIGTPIWAGKMSCAALAYLKAMAQDGKAPKAVAFITTSGSDNAVKTMAQMEKVCGKAPVAVASFSEKDVKSGSYARGLESFAAKIAPPAA